MAERAPSGYPKTERESAVYWLGVADALILAFAEAGSEESKAAAKRMERTYPGAAAGVMAIASMRALDAEALAQAHREGWQAAIEAAAQGAEAFGDPAEDLDRFSIGQEVAAEIRALPYQPPEDRGDL